MPIFVGERSILDLLQDVTVFFKCSRRFLLRGSHWWKSASLDQAGQFVWKSHRSLASSTLNCHVLSAERVCQCVSPYSLDCMSGDLRIPRSFWGARCRRLQTWLGPSAILRTGLPLPCRKESDDFCLINPKHLLKLRLCAVVLKLFKSKELWQKRVDQSSTRVGRTWSRTATWLWDQWCLNPWQRPSTSWMKTENLGRLQIQHAFKSEVDYIEYRWI